MSELNMAHQFTLYGVLNKKALENDQERFFKLMAFQIDCVYPARDCVHANLLTLFNITSTENQRVDTTLLFPHITILMDRIRCPRRDLMNIGGYFNTDFFI